MLELGALGLSDWLLETLHGPENFEIFITLRQGPATPLSPDHLQRKRSALLVQQLAEAREQIDFMLGRQ